mgnify:CR=1 FL=1
MLTQDQLLNLKYYARELSDAANIAYWVKDESDKEILTNAPKIYEYMSKESKEYFSKMKILLTDNGIPFKEDDRLVRGLDYYTHTAFEFQTIEEKRQNAILAGGRYDKLIHMISVYLMTIALKF